MPGRRTATVAFAVSALAAAAMAAAPPAAASAARVVHERGPLIAFADPYGDGRPNPAAGGSARVLSVGVEGGHTVVVLRVRGLAPNRSFGAHVHVGACSANKAGGHYQNVPGVASPQSEVWLDFTTDRHGRAVAHSVQNWTFRPDGANAVVLHDHDTHADGTAGPKLGCLDVNF